MKGICVPSSPLSHLVMIEYCAFVYGAFVLHDHCYPVKGRFEHLGGTYFDWSKRKIDSLYLLRARLASLRKQLLKQEIE